MSKKAPEKKERRKQVLAPPNTEGRPAYAAVCAILEEHGWYRCEWSDGGPAAWYPGKPSRSSRRRAGYSLAVALGDVLAQEAQEHIEHTVIEVAS